MTIRLTRKSSLVIGFGIIGLFFASGIFMLYLTNTAQIAYKSEQQESEDKNQATVFDPAVPVTLSRFQRNEIRDGKKLWEVIAEKGRYLPTGNKAELEEAQLLFYRKDGSLVELTADNALLAFRGTDLGSADVSGNVELIYNERVRIRTDNAIYKKLEDEVTVPGEVNIKTDTLEITGKNLKLNIETQEMFLREDVTTVIQPRKK